MGSIEVTDDCSIEWFMQNYDADQDGSLGIHEFRACVETQINICFDLFSRGGHHITVGNLRRVAIETQVGVSEDDLSDMMCMVGSPERTSLEDTEISREEFEEIFLMKAIPRSVQVESAAFLRAGYRITKAHPRGRLVHLRQRPQLRP